MRFSRSKQAHLVSAVALIIVAFAWALAAAPQAEPTAKLQIVSPEPGQETRIGQRLSVLVVTSLQDLKSITIQCDDNGIGQVDRPPYLAILNTKDLPAGPHTLRAFAYLKDGGKVGAEPVTISLVAGEPAPPALSGRKPQVLKEGTPLMLQLTERLVSGASPVGSPANLVAAQEVLGPENEVLIERGAAAAGVVTESKRVRTLGPNARLAFTVHSVSAVDWSEVPLRCSKLRKDRARFAFAITAGWAGLGFRRRDVWADPGTPVPGVVDADTEVRPTMIRATGPQTPSGESISVEVRGGKETKGRRRLRVGETLYYRVVPTPREKLKLMRVLLNNVEVLRREWVIREGDYALETKGLKKGKQELIIDVVFNDGYVVGQSVPFDLY